MGSIPKITSQLINHSTNLHQISLILEAFNTPPTFIIIPSAFESKSAAQTHFPIGIICIQWVSSNEFNHNSPTTPPQLMKPIPSESHLTTLSYHINFTSSQSKLMEKNPFSHGYQLGISWVSVGISQCFGYSSTTAGPN